MKGDERKGEGFQRIQNEGVLWMEATNFTLIYGV